jgi:hypothetical protein
MNSTIIINKSMLTKIIGYYLLNTLNILGFFLNIFCVVILYKIVKREQNNQGHLFKYLFIKSISDCLFCLVNIPNIFYYTKDLVKSESFIMQVWYIVGYFYCYALFSEISIWFEIYALIDCLCLVSMKFQWHKNKLCFKIVALTLITFFTIFYVPLFIKMEIVKKLNGNYEIRNTEFGKSVNMEYYLIVHSILRDVLPVCISFILNSFILCYIKKSTFTRQRIGAMNNSSDVTNQANKLVAKSINAERNKIKMIFFTSCMHVFHIPIIFYNLNLFNVQSSFMFQQLCVFFADLYFATPIVSYIGFNNTFRKYFLKIVLFYKYFR